MSLITVGLFLAKALLVPMPFAQPLHFHEIATPENYIRPVFL